MGILLNKTQHTIISLYKLTSQMKVSNPNSDINKKLDTAPVTHKLKSSIRRHEWKNLIGFPGPISNTGMEPHIIKDWRICKWKSQIRKTCDMGIHLNLTIDLTFHQNSIPESKEFFSSEYKRSWKKSCRRYQLLCRSFKIIEKVQPYKVPQVQASSNQ